MGASGDSTPLSPREVLEKYHSFVRGYDIEGVVATFAEDGQLEFPFTPAGSPSVLSGREEIRTFLAPLYRQALESGRRILGYDPFSLHETTDPETIVYEFTAQGESAGGKSRFRRSFVQVVQIRGGKIARLRDYFDPTESLLQVAARG